MRCTATASTTDSKLKATVSGVNMGGLCATVGGTLTIESRKGSGTKATIKIPKEESEDDSNNS